MNESKGYKRHQKFWSLVRGVSKSRIKRKYKYSYDLAPSDLKGPYLVVSNRSTDDDAFLTGLSFPQQMYFAVNEFALKKESVSKFIKWAFEPIIQTKGTDLSLTEMKITRVLRTGRNVCFFPEINAPFNGRTGYIPEDIGELVKNSQVALVTYRIEGGYFTTPRWAKEKRKGVMHGGIVNIYSREKIAQMQSEAITKAIRKDLQENAYVKQKQNQIRYKGKNLAEGLECSLCVCPKCREIDSIVTVRNSVYCKKCGVAADIDEYGYFTSDFKFRTVEEWDNYQEKVLKDYIKNFEGKRAYFSDSELTMHRYQEDKKDEVLENGIFSFYKDHLSFKTTQGELKVKIENITDMNLFGKGKLVFSDNKGVTYSVKSELKKDQLQNLRKYYIVWTLIK